MVADNFLHSYPKEKFLDRIFILMRINYLMSYLNYYI